jgi:hypothetical protein
MIVSRDDFHRLEGPEIPPSLPHSLEERHGN